MSSQPYPLLIQGLFTNANAGQQTIEPAGAGSFGWQNKITTGRGKLVLLDFITTNIDPVNPGMKSLGRFNYIVGGQTVVQNMEMRSFIPSAYPRSNEILILKQPGGQSVSLNFINTADAAGLVVHHYFENQFATAEVIEARNTSELKQRIQEITNAFQTGIKGGTSQEFTVPTGIGNVVAVEFILNIPSSKDAPMIVEVKPKSRSLDQNAKLHAMFADIAASKFEFVGKARTAEEWKVILISGHSIATGGQGEVIAGIEGELICIRESSASMSVSRMASLIEYVAAFGAEHGIQFRDVVYDQYYGVER